MSRRITLNEDPADGRFHVFYSRRERTPTGSRCRVEHKSLCERMEYRAGARTLPACLRKSDAAYVMLAIGARMCPACLDVLARPDSG
jgi:hypothetical protein